MAAIEGIGEAARRRVTNPTGKRWIRSCRRCAGDFSVSARPRPGLVAVCPHCGGETPVADASATTRLFV